jgi:3-oxoacyl-(acyl-carrier-protein) synthase III
MTQSPLSVAPVISGFGAYSPPRVVSNHELAQFVDTDDEWIVTRTGIHTRHYAEEQVLNSDLALPAAQKALAASGIPASAITHILYATCTPDAACPSSACYFEEKLGIRGAMALDMNAACTGFIYGLELARNLAIASPEATILIVGAELFSKHLNWKDRSTCVLFGDGAGAALVSGKHAPQPDQNTLTGRIRDVLCTSDGSLASFLVMNGGYSSHSYRLGDTVGEEYFLSMSGRDVFKHAVRCMNRVSQDILERNGLTIDDVDVVIPHQANLRIIEAVGSRLGAPETKVFNNVHKYGNTSAASIPLALSEAIDQGFVRKGHTVLAVSFGAGFTWASSLIQF